MPTPRRRVDILIAVYPGNTEDITRNFPLIQKACRETLPFVRWRITLAYNGHPSSLEEIKRLAQNEKHVRVTYVKKPGKGMALLNTLIRTDADIAAYMDADLATSLKDLPTLIREIEKGADLVGGSRYHPQSKITRDLIRRIVSWCYTRILLRVFLGARFTDPQCGFKAMRMKSMIPILRQVEDSWFFFETEFTYRAQQKGLRIVEIPVEWEERANSSVKLVPTILNFTRNLLRLRGDSVNSLKKPNSLNKPVWMEPVKVVVDAPYAR